MRGRLSTIAAGLLVAGALGAGAPAANATCSIAQSTATTVGTEVGTGGYTFNPCNIAITTGTTITWSITPSGFHTATSDPGVPERFNFTGDGGSHRFPTPGTFSFHCRFHAEMTATVHVTGADLNQAPTAALAQPAAATTGQPVALDATGSTDPDAGDTLTYQWDLDGDNAFELTTTGPTTSATFATAGAHAVRVQVVDDHGKASAPVSRTVDVTQAPPAGGGGTGGSGGGPGPAGGPAFGGVTLGAKSVTAKHGVLRLRVSCPAGTTGGCAGRLTLKDGAKRVATKAFTAGAGRAATVKLKLSAAEARKLRKRHRLRLRLTIAAHDGAGRAAAARTVKLTVRH
jgi:plastocyanin